MSCEAIVMHGLLDTTHAHNRDGGAGVNLRARAVRRGTLHQFSMMSLAAEPRRAFDLPRSLSSRENKPEVSISLW